MTTLDCSEYNSKATTVICDLCKSMEERRPEIDELLSCLTKKNVVNAVVSEEKDEEKGSDFNAEDEEKGSDFNAEGEDSKVEDSAAVEVESNPSNKKKKPKQGKGGAVVSEEGDEENDDAKYSDSNVEEDGKTVANTSKKGKGKNKQKTKSKKRKGKRK